MGCIIIPGMVWMIEWRRKKRRSFCRANGGARFIRGDQVKTDDIGCCSICFEEFDKPEKNIDVAVLCCSHVLHSDCLVPWIVKGKYTYPMCRFNLISY
ncbi:hypothetical protein RDABS01_037395 [Bienertia sinuspersici]